MPDLPPKRRRDLPTVKGRNAPAPQPGRYAELHCRTNFSFLTGASHPDELVHRAAELGLAALAVTDVNSLAGVVRAHVAAKEFGIKLLIGAEIVLGDAPPVVLLATDRASYARLSTLITHGRRRAPKGECELAFEDVLHHAEGLIACVPLQACLMAHKQDWLGQYREGFGDRCYALAELHGGPHAELLLARMQRLAGAHRVPLVAANDVRYHIAERQPLHDVLLAIRHRCTVDELGDRRLSNRERHLKSAADMRRLFHVCPEAVARTMEVADRCTFNLQELKYEYPEELCPAGMTPRSYLAQLTREGVRQRYPQGTPEKVRRQINHELALISDLHYEPYFLTVWDVVRFARSRGILCQGRGSAANSAVCYCLGITEVDPARIDVLFERFVSRERDEPPDIDVDFEHERREEVIQYLYAKYGRERAGMTATVITYRFRSAVRDVGTALGFSLDCVARLAGSCDHLSNRETLAERFREAGVNPDAPPGRQFATLVLEILGFPRHLSQHVGGMLMTRGKLSELVPIENAAMQDRTVVQWDKDDLDALGILKVDCLALGMLTAIHRCLNLIEHHERRKLTLANIPPEDPAVYEMVSRADTIGIFQIESRAQMAMLPRLKPNRFYDLVIEVALVRPGPIQGEMVHPYLRRRNGEEPVDYPDDRIRAVLERTLGVPIFQEQAMRLAVVAAGFTPGEADQLRRAMGAWRRPGIIDRFHAKLIDGMIAHGYSAEFARRVYQQIQGFGDYGFPESHAASFALLVYVSAWLKRYHPAAFAAALLNSQPMGFYAPAQLVADARRHDVAIRPVDVCASEWDCTLERDRGRLAVRLGFRMVRGLPRRAADTIVACRHQDLFRSFEDFRLRTRFSSSLLALLSRADAFRSIQMSSRQALWQALPDQRAQPLLETEQAEAEPRVRLPLMAPQTQVLHDYTATGLSLKAHPLAAYRRQLRRQGVVSAAELAEYPEERRVRVAGLVLLRQHPGSARGITFVSLEDETGMSNLVVHPGVWNRFRGLATTSSALIARGILQRESGVVHVVVDRLQDLSAVLSGTRLRSRDFR